MNRILTAAAVAFGAAILVVAAAGAAAVHADSPAAASCDRSALPPGYDLPASCGPCIAALPAGYDQPTTCVAIATAPSPAVAAPPSCDPVDLPAGYDLPAGCGPTASATAKRSDVVAPRTVRHAVTAHHRTVALVAHVQLLERTPRFGQY